MNHVMHFEIFATISHKMHHPYYLFHPSNNVMTGWMDNLGECIKIKTVSARITNNSYYSVPYNISYVKEFEQMLIFLNKTFPTVFNNDFVQVLVLVYLHVLPPVQVHTVNQYSLLVRVEGSAATSNPYMLTAHLDVAPVTRPRCPQQRQHNW